MLPTKDNMDTTILEHDWTTELQRLTEQMYLARLSGYRVAETTESMQLRGREIERLEGAAILDATNPTGAINGSNESTRKKQTLSLLETIRNQPEHPVRELLLLQEHDKAELDIFQKERDAAIDSITICKLKLEHVNCLLRAMAG